MKTLYIHIGCPKTATTSIQYFCNENKEILSKNGIYFPIFEQKYKDVNPYRNGHFLIAHQYDSKGKINTLDEHRIFRFNMDHIIYMFSKYNNILLSDESIWHSAHFFKKDLWETLKKESLKSAFKIKIIVYLRRQDTSLNSMWNQKIKKSKQRFRSMSWEEFINTTPPAIYLDYEEGLNEIASELGPENIIVRRYGKKYFKNGSIYDDFLSTLGLSLTDDYTITTFERNPRLSSNSNEMQRIFNSIPNATKKDFSFFYHMLSEVSSEDPDTEKLGMFTPEEASAFMENYRASNRRIMEKYFNCSEDLFKTNFKNIKKWEWDSRHMCEDIIRVLGNTTISLRKENEDMQQHILELEKAIELQNENISTLKTKLKRPVRTLFQKIADSTH